MHLGDPYKRHVSFLNSPTDCRYNVSRFSTSHRTVFIHHEWKIAVVFDRNNEVSGPDEGFSDAVSQFLASYIPLVSMHIYIVLSC